MANFNLDKTLEVAVENFAQKEPGLMAENAGVAYKQESKVFIVPYFGKQYEISFPEGQVKYVGKEGEVSINNKILLLHYLSNSRGTAISGKKISFKELPNGAIYNDPFYRRTIQPMLSIFGSQAAKLEELGRKLGGEPAGLGDFSITMPLFPRISVTYVIWEGDEEFPASGTVLFDETAKDYLPTEDNVILASSVIWAFKAMATN